MDVTDHNHIYPVLKGFTDDLNKAEKFDYTAAISSGTPAMQVCWILLAESGDFSETNKLNLIKVKDPAFGESENIPVIIETSLPQIIRLKNEIKSLKNNLIPQAILTIDRPGLKIGDVEIILSPMELTYYMYFVERKINGQDDEKFSGFNTSNKFLNRIIELHKKLYPDLESNRMELEHICKRNIGLSIYTYRGNVSKLNKKINASLLNETVANSFKISSNGGRGAKYYGIQAPREKLLIVE